MHIKKSELELQDGIFNFDDFTKFESDSLFTLER